MAKDLLKKWQSQLLKGTLELYILGSIVQQDRYAFEIIQALKALEGLVSEGSIYPLLKRLEKEGLITTYWRESQGGPPRKYYQLTPNGQENFSQMRQEWHHFSNFLNHHLQGVTAHESLTPSESSKPSRGQGLPLTFKETP